MKFIRLSGHLFLFILLTIITQVGGIIWLLSLWMSKTWSWRKRYVFPILYLTFNLVIIPPTAKLFGREKLPIIHSDVQPINWFYPLLFRNYVQPELKTLLLNTAQESNIVITYLDANFPFYNSFPLLPHLSHNDGKKVDISFMYKDKKGNTTNKKPSVSGYGVYANSEDNATIEKCKSDGFWQYDFSKYLSLGQINSVEFDADSTKSLIKALLKHKSTQKIFIEPHLKQSLGLNNEVKVRFHGCKAVRHDDHIHLQIKQTFNNY